MAWKAKVDREREQDVRVRLDPSCHLILFLQMVFFVLPIYITSSPRRFLPIWSSHTFSSLSAYSRHIQSPSLSHYFRIFLVGWSGGSSSSSSSSFCERLRTYY